MSQWAAITVLGQDRPGIVAGVTGVLFEHGCNLEDSSATRLRDAFAMILIAALPSPPRVAELQQALRKVADRLDISVDFRDLGEAAPTPAPAGTLHTLAVYGADHPGIVFKVSQELAALDCNITDVRTRVAGSAEQPVYILMVEMVVPETASSEAVAARMAELRRELRVDITIEAVDEETL